MLGTCDSEQAGGSRRPGIFQGWTWVSRKSISFFSVFVLLFCWRSSDILRFWSGIPALLAGSVRLTRLAACPGGLFCLVYFAAAEQHQRASPHGSIQCRKSSAALAHPKPHPPRKRTLKFTLSFAPRSAKNVVFPLQGGFSKEDGDQPGVPERCQGRGPQSELLAPRRVLSLHRAVQATTRTIRDE